MTSNKPTTVDAGSQAEHQTDRIEDVLGRMKAIEKAREALLSRKPFSVRDQIIIANTVVFLFFLAVAVIFISTINRIDSSIEFLEFVNEFTIEIQQARRFEKNVFLYGTNLEDALENGHSARNIISANSDQFASILDPQQQKTVLDQLDDYIGLLQQLENIQRETPGQLKDPKLMASFENRLRQYGKDMLYSAQNLMRKEKADLAKNLQHTKDIHLYGLIALLVLLVLNTMLLVSRILFILPRFSIYAKRIAEGDFAPITPQRRFRDEFTDLAIAINEMIKEIANREVALVQTHKMKAIGTLTAGVAHELNNPMNNTMLTAHMLMEDYATLGDKERLEMIGDIIDETVRAKGIVSNLLDFAREGESSVELMDLKQLLQDTIRLAENQVRMAGIRITMEANDNLPKISGDRDKLRQVFLNLILNAVDASPKGSVIQVIAQSHKDADHVAIKVIDHGSGIPEEALPSIFDPFFTTKTKGKGTGLGLSVSQGIVAKHGGAIFVSSKVGRGTVFTVVLPVIQDQPPL